MALYILINFCLSSIIYIYSGILLQNWPRRRSLDDMGTWLVKKFQYCWRRILWVMDFLENREISSWTVSFVYRNSRGMCERQGSMESLKLFLNSTNSKTRKKKIKKLSKWSYVLFCRGRLCGRVDTHCSGVGYYDGHTHTHDYTYTYRWNQISASSRVPPPVGVFSDSLGHVKRVQNLWSVHFIGFDLFGNTVTN